MAHFDTVRWEHSDSLVLARYCTLVLAHSGKLGGGFVSSAVRAPGQPPGCTPASAPSGTIVLARCCTPVLVPAGTALLARSGKTAVARSGTPLWPPGLAHFHSSPSAQTSTAPSAPSCRPPLAGLSRIAGAQFDILALQPEQKQGSNRIMESTFEHLAWHRTALLPLLLPAERSRSSSVLVRSSRSVTVRRSSSSVVVGGLGAVAHLLVHSVANLQQILSLIYC